MFLPPSIKYREQTFPKVILLKFFFQSFLGGNSFCSQRNIWPIIHPSNQKKNRFFRSKIGFLFRFKRLNYKDSIEMKNFFSLKKKSWQQMRMHARMYGTTKFVVFLAIVINQKFARLLLLHCLRREINFARVNLLSRYLLHSISFSLSLTHSLSHTDSPPLSLSFSISHSLPLLILIARFAFVLKPINQTHRGGYCFSSA